MPLYEFIVSIVIWPAFVASLALILCMNAPGISLALRLRDIPGGRKQHAQPTPLMGGIALLVALLPALIFWSLSSDGPTEGVVRLVALCTAGIALLGTIDDRAHLPALPRLGFCFLLIFLLLQAEPELTVGYISWNNEQPGFPLGPYALFSTMVCLVALINAANMADGKNGLLIGLSISWSLLLLYHAQEELVVPLLMLLAALIVLICFNLRGKLFLGDGGSYGLATLIGLFAIYVSRNSSTGLTADLIGLMFMIPTGDMIRLMIVRIARGRSPFVGDRDHLHHLLLDMFGWSLGLSIYLLAVLVPSVVATVLPEWTLAIIAATISVYCVFIWFAHKQRSLSQSAGAEGRV